VHLIVYLVVKCQVVGFGRIEVNMSQEINFDDLQREINAAENYLKNRPAASGSLRQSYAAPTNSNAVTSSESKPVSVSADGPLGATSWSTQFAEFESSPAQAATIVDEVIASKNAPGTPDSIGSNYIGTTGTAWGDNFSTSYTDIHAPLGNTNVNSQSHAATEYDATVTQLSSSLRASAQSTSSRNSMSPQSDAAVSSSGTESGPQTGRYTTEASREELIARLLAEHGAKGSITESTTSTSGNDSSQQPFVIDGQIADTPSSRGTYAANDATIESYSRNYERNVGRDSGNMPRPLGERDNIADNSVDPSSPPRDGADTLFFASDLHDGNNEEDYPRNMDYGDSLLLQGIMSGTAQMEHDTGYDHEKTAYNAEMAQTVDRNVRLPLPRQFDPTSYEDIQSLESESSDKNDGTENFAYPESQEYSAQAWVIDGDEGDRQNSRCSNDSISSKILAKARAASGIPSRLKENANRNWKFVKSREDCLREGEEKRKMEYTFQPKLHTRDRKHREITPNLGNRPLHGMHVNSSQVSARIEESIKAHEKSMKNREKLREHVENMEASQCTFKPVISKMANKILHKKEAKERMDHNAHCLHDTLDPYSSKIHKNKNSSDDAKKASERLYSHAAMKAEQQAYLGRQVQQERDSLCTFQPRINPNTKAMYDHMDKRYGMQHVPIHERIGELQKYKNKRLHDLRAAIEEQQQEEMPFAPAIDTKSRQMANRQRKSDTMAAAQYGGDKSVTYDENGDPQEIDVADRLLEEARQSKLRKQQLVQRLEREQAERDMPIGPSTGSTMIAQSNAFVGATFAQRQQMYENMLARKDQERQRAECESTSTWFQPNIGKSRDIIAEARPEQVVETANERTERLYRTDNEVREYRRKAKETEVYRDMTFEPTIDPLSKQLGQASTLDELVENTKGRDARDAVKRRVQAEAEKECTFMPKIKEYLPEGNLIGDGYAEHGLYAWQGNMNQSMTSIRSAATANTAVTSRQTINMHEPEKMAQQIRAGMLAKEERRRQELMHREIDELKDCTFAPKINPPPSRKQAMVLMGDGESYSGNAGDAPVIRGLGRYLELKVMTIKKAEDAEIREKEVFSVRNAESYRRQEDGATIVQPFLLSARDLRPSRAVVDMKAEADKELTFIPDTELSQRRESIRSQARAVF
jgi:hypothetical protein